jgi:type VI secretion system protein ImpA
LSDQDSLKAQVEAWLQPLSGDNGPCGTDLEYDNAFLELTKAAEGKPETQFERGTPPDWRGVRARSEELFDRTRDLRIALLWVRATLSLEGVAALEPGLALLTGLLDGYWDTLHPLPDPSDNDPYARANALAILPQMDGLLGEMLVARLVQIKGVGDIRLRDIEVALGNFTAREDEATFGREQLGRMLVTADQEGAGVRASLLQVQTLFKQIGAQMDERFGSGSSAELKPLFDVLTHALVLVPEPEAELAEGEGEAGDSGDGEGAGSGSRGSKAGLSGAVNSRAEAVRAIELVCAYLERHEPTNPAQLFLRRASALLERNFLELLKELAPNALDDVARIVGVDPNTVGESEQ